MFSLQRYGAKQRLSLRISANRRIVLTDKQHAALNHAHRTVPYRWAEAMSIL